MAITTPAWLKGPGLNLMIGYLCNIWTMLTMILSPQCVLKIVSMAIYIVLSKLFFMPFFSPPFRYVWGTYHLSISSLNKYPGGDREYFLEEMKGWHLSRRAQFVRLCRAWGSLQRASHPGIHLLLREWEGKNLGPHLMSLLRRLLRSPVLSRLWTEWWKKKRLWGDVGRRGDHP